MNSLLLSEVEKRVVRLSDEEQARLIKYLDSILEKKSPADADIQRELEMMAHDPEIQRELAVINAEFVCAESDGLG